MTRNQLVKALHSRVGLDHGLGRSQIEAMVDGVFDTITDAVRKGEPVEIPGFGRFILHITRPRSVVTPTGQHAHVRKRREMLFRAGVKFSTRNVK